MDSQFCERLDYLMSITNTANNMLVRELSFDPSYVGRIRNGKRGIPHRQPFIEPTARFLASRIEKPWQARSVAERLGVDRHLPNDQEERIALIAHWIETGDVATSLPITAASGMQPEVTPTELTEASMLIGTGPQCMREAVRRFLDAAIDTDYPPRLLLFSDESQGWLTEDAAFTAYWAEATAHLLGQGGTIEIVHNVTRNASEMFDAVRAWVPLYLTGRVRSWYLPRIRDGIFRHSTFVASGLVAVTSRSLGGENAQFTCMLTYDKSFADALECEIQGLIASCRPLATPEPLASDQDVAALLSRMGPIDEVVCRTEDADTLRSLAQGCPALEATTHLVDTTGIPEGHTLIFAGADRCALLRLDEPRLAVTLNERLAVEALREYLERT